MSGTLPTRWAATIVALGAMAWAAPAQDAPAEPAMDAARFWGLVLEHEAAGPPDGLDACTALVRDHVATRLHVVVWDAIWSQLREAELAGDTPVRHARANTLRFLGDAIAAGAGTPRFRGDIERYTTLEPEARERWWNACENLARTISAASADRPDWPSLRARLRAGVVELEAAGDTSRVLDATMLDARGAAAQGDTIAAYAAWTRARTLAAGLGDAVRAAACSDALAALERRAERGEVELRAGALSDPANADATWQSISFTVARGVGQLPYAAVPAFRDEPWFWHQIWLTDAAPRVQLPLSDDLWLVKTPGAREVALLHRGRRIAQRVGPRVRELGWIATQLVDGTAQDLPHPLECVAPTAFDLWGQERAIGVTDDALELRVRHHAARIATRGPRNAKVVIHDANGNGRFGQRWDGDQSDIGGDVLVVSGRAVPFSPLWHVGTSFYYAQPTPRSLTCRTARYTGPRGQLRVRLDGLRGTLAQCVLACTFRFPTGERATVQALIDVAGATRRPVTLPVGTWRLHRAELVHPGRGADGARVEILPGDLPSLRVTADGVSELVLGGELRPAAAVRWEAAAKTASVETSTLSVRGERGETYTGFWPTPWEYDYTIRDAVGRRLASGRARAHRPVDPVARLDDLAFARPTSHVVDGACTPPLRLAIHGEHPLLGRMRRRLGSTPAEDESHRGG